MIGAKLCDAKPLQVFKNPYEVVTVLLIQTLGAMVPSIPVCLSSAMERAAQEQRLDSLLELHQTTSTFGHSLEAAMFPHLGSYKRGRDGVQATFSHVTATGCNFMP